MKAFDRVKQFVKNHPIKTWVTTEKETMTDSELSDVSEFVFRGGKLYKGVGSRELSMNVRLIVVGVTFFICILMYHALDLNKGVTKAAFLIEISFLLALSTILQIIDFKVIKNDNPYQRTIRSSFNMVIIYLCIYIFFNIVVAQRINEYGMTDVRFYLKVSLVMLNATILSFVIGVVLISNLIKYGYFGKKRKAMDKAWQSMPKSAKCLIGILMGSYTVIFRFLLIGLRDSNDWGIEFKALCVLFAIIGFVIAYVYQTIKLAEEYGLDEELFSRETLRAEDNTTDKSYNIRKYDEHYMFVVRCADDTLYAGWTTDVEKRVAMLNSGKGPKYTRSRRPLKLVYKEDFKNKIDAENRAKYFMQLSDADKEKELRKKNEI